MLGAIVAFRMTIERVDAKFKLSQNRSAEDRDRVIAGAPDEAYAEASRDRRVDGRVCAQA